MVWASEMKKIYLLFWISVLGASHFIGSSIPQQLDAYLQACTDLGYFSGSVLIAKGGKLLVNKGYGLSNHEHSVPNSPATQFRLSSLSKPFVSLAIMKLQEKGLLTVNDRLSDYISDYPRGNEITIHHLLTHTSGIKNYTALSEFQTFKKLPATIPQIIERFKYLGLAANPGSVYKFCNSNYALLCFIIERVTGQSHYEYIKEHILKPAGMINTGYDTHCAIVPGRAAGYMLENNELVNADYTDITAAVGLGSFYSTVEDMYLFNKALDTPLLASRNSLEQMFTPYAQIGDKEDNIMYGYGWATITLAGHEVKKHIAGIDGFSTAMYRFADENMFIVVLSNFQHALTEPLSFDLAAILCNQPYELPTLHKPFPIDTRLYNDYVGKYEYKGLIYRIEQKGDSLFFKQPDKASYQLFAESETQFFINGIPIVVRFVKDADGVVTHLITKAFGKERVLQKKQC